MDETLRKHTLGVMGVYGDEPKLEIMGLFLWRGADIPKPMLEHPQFEYFKKQKLDPKNESDRKLVSEFWIKGEDEVVNDKKC